MLAMTACQRLLTMVYCTLCLTLLVESKGTNCTSMSAAEKDAAHLRLHEQWISSYSSCMDPSFMNILPFQNLAKKKNRMTDGSRCFNSEWSGCDINSDAHCASCRLLDFIGNNNSCPKDNPISGSGTLIENDSICPFYWIESLDKKRYPEKMAEARCACTDCKNGQGGTMSGVRNTCVPVSFNTPVLYESDKADVKGICIYETKFTPLSVGCICALVR